MPNRNHVRAGRNVYTLALVALTAGQVAGQDAAAIDAFLTACEAYRPRAIVEATRDRDAAQKELAALQQAAVNRQATQPGKLPNGRRVFPTAKAKADAVDAAT